MAPHSDTSGAAVNLAEDENSPAIRRRRRIVDDLTMAVLTVLFLAGITNAAGVRSTEQTAAVDGYRLRVHHATWARPGLAVPLEVVAELPKGATAPLRLAISARYLALFDENGIHPQPDSEAQRGPWLVLRYDQPVGGRVRVVFDERIEPAVQSGRHGAVALLDAEGRPLVRLSFRTNVLP